MWVLMSGDIATAGSYANSAHGNTSYGVNRSGTGYAIGDCANCHNSCDNEFMLFAPLFTDQGTGFCFKCHTDPTESFQTSMQNQYSYSYTRGGDTSLTCPDSVYKSFQFVDNNGVSQLNCGSSVGSSHLLKDIGNFIKGKAGFPSIPEDVNPCDACHNPHRAKRDYPCSRPSAHTDLPTWNLWGDDASEKIDAITDNYWAPKRVGGGYEPDDSGTQDGSNMPNYVRLCIDCHNSTNTIFSTRLGRNLRKVNWTLYGDFHGNRPRIDDGYDFLPDYEWGDILSPYKESGSYEKTNYVLNCTDCHEPHGSPNEFLLRKTVNGTQIDTISENGKWFYWCKACHYIPTFGSDAHGWSGFGERTDCYNNGSCHRHCDDPNCFETNLF